MRKGQIGHPGAVLLSGFCNIFGTETGGADSTLGGLGGRPDRQWYCPNRYVGRFRMRCQHGHQGQVMKICEKHRAEFATAVTFCPRCNKDPKTGHKCRLRIEAIA